MRNRVYQSFLNKTEPVLGTLLGSKRAPYTDWKLSTDPRPPAKLDFKQDARHLHKKIDFRRPYRILCLDGGGVRGLLTTTLLERILVHRPDFLKSVDFICGTSAGGLLALQIAAGYTPKELYHRIIRRNLNPYVSKYSDLAKEEIMKEYFGNRTMMDLEKVCAVVAFRLDGRQSKTHSFFNRNGWRPAVFSNMPKGGGLVEPDTDLFVWDAAMRTSAAPTYFPVYNGYVDGGVVANDPSALAVTKVFAHYSHVTARNVTVLSLGAGRYPHHLQLRAHSNRHKTTDSDTAIGKGGVRGWHADWGIGQWYPYLLDLLMDGGSVTTEMNMNYLLGRNKLYHRLDPEMPRAISLDDVTAMGELRDLALSVDMTDTFQFVDRNFNDDDFSHYDHTMETNALDHTSQWHDDAWMHMLDSEVSSLQDEAIDKKKPPLS